jgi:hypothetical protein
MQSVGATAMTTQRIDVEDLPAVFFRLFREHNYNPRDPRLKEEIERLEFVCSPDGRGKCCHAFKVPHST